VSFSQQFLAETVQIASQTDFARLDAIAEGLAEVRARGGRLFFLGVGGSAGNCGHAVNDFRKLCGFEAYAPTDNVSELTARINDDGWDGIFVGWLRGSKLSAKDGLFIFSVGGGNLEKNVSTNLVRAIQYGQELGAGIFGVVGRDDGFAAKASKLVAVVPMANPAHVTPHSEAFQAVFWHLLVSHPALKQQPTKWESLAHR
jgi:D-sedoheptulose 7-phosphate isomerase